MAQQTQSSQTPTWEKARQWLAPVLAGLVIFSINKVDSRLERIDQFMLRIDTAQQRQNWRLDYLEVHHMWLQKEQDEQGKILQSLIGPEFMKPEDQSGPTRKTKNR